MNICAVLHINDNVFDISMDEVPRERDIVHVYDHNLMREVYENNDITKENMFEYDSIRVRINEINKVYNVEIHGNTYSVCSYDCYCGVEL